MLTTEEQDYVLLQQLDAFCIRYAPHASLNREKSWNSWIISYMIEFLGWNGREDLPQSLRKRWVVKKANTLNNMTVDSIKQHNLWKLWFGDESWLQSLCVMDKNSSWENIGAEKENTISLRGMGFKLP